MRQKFVERQEVLPLPNLSSIQQTSFEWFLREGVGEILEEISPIEDYTGRGWQLFFAKPRFGEPNRSVEEAVANGLTYDAPWFLEASLKDNNSKKSSQSEVYMGDLPIMTGNGTFVINGVERVVVNQLTRAEGVFFVGDKDPTTGKILIGAKILPKNGAWLEFETSRSRILTVKIDRRRKIAATTLLRVFGLDDNEAILAKFASVDTDPENSFLQATLARDPAISYNEAILEIYRKMRPGEPAVLENAEALFQSLFLEHRRYDLGKVGRYKINKRLNLNLPNEKSTWVLTRNDIVSAISYLISLQNFNFRFSNLKN